MNHWQKRGKGCKLHNAEPMHLLREIVCHDALVNPRGSKYPNARISRGARQWVMCTGKRLIFRQVSSTAELDGVRTPKNDSN